MLLTVSYLKAAMGLEDPEVEDPVVDPNVETAILSAQTLVSAYVGFNIEVQGDPETHVVNYPKPFRALSLPKWPVYAEEPVTVVVDGTTLTDATDYRVHYRNGTVVFTRDYTSAKQVTITYFCGFDSFTVPQDLKLALQNIAIAIYNMPPGGFGAASGTGPLKSMTMFDAMSISFDTTADQASANTPAGLVGQWSFVLDKYRVSQFWMSGVA